MSTYLPTVCMPMQAHGEGNEARADNRDSALIRRIAEGDPDAVAALYQRHGGLIFRFSLRLSKDKNIAEEVTQEVFLALIRQASGFDASRGELATWLCGIARNLVWKQLRRSRQWEPLDDEQGAPAGGCETANAYEAVEKSALSALLWKCIEELPPLLREVLILCEFEELSYQAAAVITNVPIGTVRSRLSRAKARLAQLLRESGT